MAALSDMHLLHASMKNTKSLQIKTHALQ